MQRFVNNPDNVVEDTVKGFVKAHKDIVRLGDNPRVIIAKDAPIANKVGIVSGGGSGHEPAFIGYTGKNMLDAVAVGELFSSPTAKSFHDAIRAANGGKGVIVLYGNYAGDNMNVKMATKLAEKDGIEVATVVANDDVCSASFEERNRRRGVAGEIMMWKIAGAKAAKGASLEEVKETAQRTIDNCRSIGVGLGPCTLPAVGHPNFQIEPGTMEVGIGHHGEPGVRVEPLKQARDVAKDMAKIVLDDHNLPEGTEVAVLVSGLGATPVNELYILNDTIEEEITARGLKVYKTYVGNYFTSLEMVGAPRSSRPNFKKQQLTEQRRGEYQSRHRADKHQQKCVITIRAVMRVFAIFIRQITRGVDRDQQTEKHHHKQNQRTHAINDQAKQRHIPHVDQRQRDGNFIGLIKRGDQRQHAQRGQCGE